MKQMINVLFPLICLIMILLTCSKDNVTEPAPTTGTIKGTVTNPTGDSLIIGAIITTDPPTSSVTTLNNGEFTITDVQPGTYTVTAFKDGYNPGNVSISVQAGKTVTANIQLAVLLSNRPPSEPLYISPSNNSSEQNILLTFEWNTSIDPDGDQVFYDFYLGATDPPSLDNPNLTSTSITKTDLDFSIQYYWKIVAKDNQGASNEGETWNFRTAEVPLDPFAYYPFSGNADDESGNGNHGTVYGASLTTDRFGQNNRAYSFSGNGDYINTNFTPNFIFTISIWYNKSQTQNSNAGLFSTYSGGFNYSGVYYSVFETVDAIRCDGNSLDSFNSSALNWKHIVIVSDGVRVKVYENTNKKLDFVGTTSHSNLLVIGDSRYNGRYFTGKIDDIRVYNRALNDKEISALYHENGWSN